MSVETTVTKAWGAKAATSPLEFLEIPRRVPGATDVAISIDYCGICHSDYHCVKGEWPGTKYNCVPGHEIVGTVTAVGSDVTKFKVGDTVGVGCMVDSCRTCDQCAERKEEQFCRNGNVGTYNAPDKHLNSYTFGGYSEAITVDEAFVLKVPSSIDKAAAAPLLCAGITTYSPLRKAGVKKGSRVGVVGLGGLGHMAIKIAVAMGAVVTIITTSPSKVADAQRLGATKAILSTKPEDMAAAAGSLDVIIDTVSAAHDVGALINLLDVNGNLSLVGANPEAFPIASFPLVFGHKTIVGSLIGGIKETQEMLDFCAEHGIASDIETIGVTDINNAYERMLKSDVKYRFVIDMKTLKEYKA